MMCTIQVLLLPEVTVRREPSSTPRNICRRLFAANDEGVTEKRAQFLSAVQEDLEKQNRERWNFDFRTETPLPGRYQWMPLCASATHLGDSVVSEVPQAYGQRASSSSLRQTHKLAERTQSKITDFLFHRKRQRTFQEAYPISRLKS